jgi:hypothetical protein
MPRSRRLLLPCNSAWLRETRRHFRPPASRSSIHGLRHRMPNRQFAAVRLEIIGTVRPSIKPQASSPLSSFITAGEPPPKLTRSAHRKVSCLSIFGPGVNGGSLDLGDTLEFFGELGISGPHIFTVVVVTTTEFHSTYCLVRPAKLCSSSSVSISRTPLCRST